MRFSLRPYQMDGVNRLRQAFIDGCRAPLYCLPTGGGKTVCFCYIIERSTTRGRRVIVVVHRRELLLQCSRALGENGISHGIIAPGFTPTQDRVQVASIQTLVRRLDRVPEPDLLVYDECHHVRCGGAMMILEKWRKTRILGVTATPCRLDGKGLGSKSGGVFDALVMGPSVAELTAGGYLAPADVYAPPGVDMAGVHTRMGDFDHREAEARVDKPVITGCAVTHYRRLADGRPAIAFCASVKHAHHVAEEFRNAGYPSQAIDGTMREVDRDLAMSALASGALTVLTACEIISEGVDIPRVEVGILLRPTQSTALHMQQVGRCLRPSQGKPKAVILDHVGNCLRHGLPTSDRQWSLEGGMVKAKGTADGDELSIRQCPQCFNVHEWSPQCPRCGHVYEAREKRLETVDGTLKKLTPDEIQKRKIFIVSRQEQGRCRELSDLAELAKKRGYSEGWVKHVWRARQQAKGKA